MKPDVYDPDALDRDPRPPLSDYGRRLLAEGDSWFTISTAKLFDSANLLLYLEFTKTTAIVSCAYPGDTLQHMVDGVNDPDLDKLLRRPRHQRYWEAIVVSAGGNDLIDAAAVRPTQPDGSVTPRELRLLLTPAEAGARAGAADFVSEPGFELLSRYLLANFGELVRRRDDGISKGRPLFAHTYATPTARPAGTLGTRDGWLYPSFVAWGIPEPMWQPVTELLFGRLRRLLLSLDSGSGHANALPQVHVFDSAALPDLVAAQPGTRGPSGDWVNEIHLTKEGCEKVGRAFGPMIESVLARYPG